MRKIWFITGATTATGADIVKAALAQGDCVVATDGNASALCTALPCADAQRLLALPLSVADGRAVADALALAVARFGRIDVVVHAETLHAAIDDRSRWPDTDFVRGLFNLTRAALAHMRAQRHGRIHHLVPERAPDTGASMFSIERFCSAVALDVAATGIAVTPVMPERAHADIFAAWSMGEDPLLEAV